MNKEKFADFERGEYTMQHWTQIISGIVKVGIAHLVGLM